MKHRNEYTGTDIMAALVACFGVLFLFVGDFWLVGVMFLIIVSTYLGYRISQKSIED